MNYLLLSLLLFSTYWFEKQATTSPLVEAHCLYLIKSLTPQDQVSPSDDQKALMAQELQALQAAFPKGWQERWDLYRIAKLVIQKGRLDILQHWISNNTLDVNRPLAVTITNQETLQWSFEENYKRKLPPGTRVPSWYQPDATQTHLLCLSIIRRQPHIVDYLLHQGANPNSNFVRHGNALQVVWANRNLPRPAKDPAFTKWLKILKMILIRDNYCQLQKGAIVVNTTIRKLCRSCRSYNFRYSLFPCCSQCHYTTLDPQENRLPADIDKYSQLDHGCDTYGNYSVSITSYPYLPFPILFPRQPPIFAGHCIQADPQWLAEAPEATRLHIVNTLIQKGCFVQKPHPTPYTTEMHAAYQHTLATGYCRREIPQYNDTIAQIVTTYLPPIMPDFTQLQLNPALPYHDLSSDLSYFTPQGYTTWLHNLETYQKRIKQS